MADTRTAQTLTANDYLLDVLPHGRTRGTHVAAIVKAVEPSIGGVRVTLYGVRGSIVLPLDAPVTTLAL